MFAQKRLVPWLIPVTALILMAGCVDQDDPVSPPLTDQPELSALLDAPFTVDWPSAVLRAGYPWPDSPDQAIANFRNAYHDEDVASYALMLAPGFRFVLQSETVEEYDLARGALDVNDEIRIAFNMCLGVPSMSGERLTDIAVARMEPLTLWEPVPEDDPHFGALVDAERRRYDVRLTFTRRDQVDPFTVEGEVLLVVVPENHPEATGSSRIAYRLVGGYDETVREEGTNEMLWGSLKVLFR